MMEMIFRLNSDGELEYIGKLIENEDGLDILVMDEKDEKDEEPIW